MVLQAHIPYSITLLKLCTSSSVTPCIRFLIDAYLASPVYSVQLHQ